MAWLPGAVLSVAVFFVAGSALLPVFGDWTLLIAIVIAAFFVAD